jgi:hypothetical protein
MPSWHGAKIKKNAGTTLPLPYSKDKQQFQLHFYVIQQKVNSLTLKRW